MEYSEITASDGCTLAFQTSLPLLHKDGDGRPTSSSPPGAERSYKKLILLIHGFSGSSAYFQKNFSALSASWVVAVDLRGHGRSGRPRGGYHVARLAADLKELIAHLRSSVPTEHDAETDVVPVGCSIGAAVLWTYVELFGDADFAGMAFVDQAPLQDRSSFDAWDEGKAHRGCFDEASMLGAQRAWIERPEDAFKGLAADCLGYRYQPLPGDDVSEERRKGDEDFFTGESRKCDTRWLARLLADHTRYDHREACEGIRVPVLVLAGKRTGCFPLEGMKETVRRVEKGRRDRGESQGIVRWSEYGSGHWLFWEEPEKFNKEIAVFVEECTRP
ncbi:Alpha/Beta hydrolase protein [Truncatella angustata]|uniref:Alpha/Beta hydrolase protein n=1 Tax=Truncatella angustata TaxID=152316 RepID=A0A9P8RKV6_9PEZI|nr:Alpha/Beta hydrolase protein [Truncatella angustata]KAH6645160.1 Alpha/Beta hydrolase protein [Truncatella angustata]